jgi:hypothetical protein
MGLDVTWITVNNLQDSHWLERYITSFYWAVLTMITVGYGDITPVNVTERGFVITMTIISCGVFAYSVNSVGTIMSNLNSRKK